MTDFMSGKVPVAGAYLCPSLLTRELNKTLRIMKLAALLLFAAVMQVSAKGLAQEKINLAMTNASLDKVFDQIEAQTGFVFIYKNETVKDKKISIKVSNASLTQTLDLCLKGQALSYQVIGRSVAIKVEKGSAAAPGVGEAPPYIDVSGRVVNEKGDPVEGVTVTVKGGAMKTLTDKNGEFSLATIDKDATLVFTHVSMESFELKVSGKTEIAITLKARIRELSDVVVTVNTGYQTISKERATGSYVKIDNELLSRRVSTNILDRLDGVTSGLLFNRTKVGNNTPDISIRGRSTIFANADPLIILDNFPYTGDINNINPNDIESVTILKDATASSIWGALSGNGVIVITTKKGKVNQAPKITINSNVSVSDIPDLYYNPQLSSSDFIDVERFLFDKGKYSLTLNNAYAAISPVVALLVQNKAGTLSKSDLEAKLDLLRRVDTRDDFKKYFYKRAVNQQYAVNVSGGGAYQSYFLSAGLDKNMSNFRGSSYDRFTINGKNTYYAFDKKLEISSGILFSFSKSKNNSNPYSPNLPYEQVVDGSGNALPVVRDFRKSYIDTAGGGRLLDWSYVPLYERNSNATKDLVDYRINLEVGYNILPSLKASFNYQYGKGNIENTTYNGVASYYTRNLINSFTALQAGSISRPLPLGDILKQEPSNYKNSYLRGQLSYDKTFHSIHNITAIAGIEVKEYQSHSNSFMLYGYDGETATDVQVDYLTFFPQYYGGGITKRIAANSGQGELADRFRSFYGNVAYSYNDRYVLSVSARRDESNLFGVKTNQKGVPLWSAGVSWNISKEAFYKIQWLPFLKLRLTNGYNGNVDKTTSAYTTARIETTPNSFGATYATIVNPPNPALRWEKVQMTNVGADFSFKNNVVSGSLEYYVKNGKDLIGNGPVAPQTGVSQFRGNVADLRTKGVDVIINTKNINSTVKWVTNFLFSYSKDVVTKYKVLQSSNSAYIQNNFLNPIEGKPYSGLFSYPWAGLDSVGDPQGYLGGKVSKDYTGMVKSVSEGDMVYSGPGIPTVFGSVRNTFSWKNFDLSFNITYKLGYYFRRNSLNYTDLFAGNYRQADFAKRWVQPGDEASTFVPSMIYPANSSRDAFYNYSQILIQKGDHVRFQDLQVSYTLNNQRKTFPLQSMRVYAYANNLGIIWKSNNSGLDPDAVGVMPMPKSFSIGLTATF